MTYVMSDIHGEYEKFMQMLSRIDLSPNDELFILGDIVDRGADPVKILKYIIDKPNIIPLLGNHEAMALSVLRRLNVEITAENCESHIDTETIENIMDYMQEGGDTTLKDFKQLPPAEREMLISFMEDFSLYETVDVGDASFILVHAGLGNFGKDKKLSEYTPEELLGMRPVCDGQRFDFGLDSPVYIVAGHTPTKLICGKWEIYRDACNIYIDCGAVFGGRLACLRLDDMKEYYV